MDLYICKRYMFYFLMIFSRKLREAVAGRIVIHMRNVNGQKVVHIAMLQVNVCGVTVVPTKSDSDVILCLQLLSKTLTCTLHLS